MKIFRSFREKSLVRRKFTKYLIYAIGEIILVVIGILIALQVNNWNENRKNNELRRGYTAAIINDLEKDSLNLQVYIDKMFKDGSVLKSFEERIQNSESKSDTIKKIFRYEFPYYVRPDYSFNNNTLRSMIQNNDNRYPEDIIAEMASMVKAQTDFEELNKLSIDKYFDILHQMDNYPFENYFFNSGSDLRDMIWEEVDDLQLIKDFERLADWKLAYSNLILSYAQGMQKQCSFLKQHLQNLEAN